MRQLRQLLPDIIQLQGSMSKLCYDRLVTSEASLLGFTLIRA